MVTFFALLAHKITSSILSNLFLCNPLELNPFCPAVHIEALPTQKPH